METVKIQVLASLICGFGDRVGLPWLSGVSDLRLLERIRVTGGRMHSLEVPGVGRAHSVCRFGFVVVFKPGCDHMNA